MQKQMPFQIWVTQEQSDMHRLMAASGVPVMRSVQEQARRTAVHYVIMPACHAR